MKVSRHWLLELAPNIGMSAAEMAERLAERGAPIESITAPWESLADVVVGRVVDVRKHPDADRLSLCAVDAGGDEPLPVVCGAPNVEAGANYPFAPVGATLPGGVRIKKARIRGESSRGMLCSERELGLGEDHEGILLLGDGLTPGGSFTSAAGLDDAMLDVEVTANRADLLSHVGVARELGAYRDRRVGLPVFPGGGDLGLEWVASGSGSDPSEIVVDGLRVRIDEPELCPRYVAAVVRGVEIGPSPGWLRRRLHSVGARPVNNVVDATNYVLLELGHPLHAFDLASMRGPSVVVRLPEDDEREFTTLDGDARAVSRSMLMICDDEGPAAVAGVMGGLGSAVTDSTTDILLECALFDPKSVRATRRALGLSTDASYRFERGVDPEGLERAVERALSLITLTSGGEVAGPIIDCAPVDFRAETIPLRLGRVERLLGVPFGVETVRELLTPLGFLVGPGSDGTVPVGVPGFRWRDVTREVDLIEEIARTHGYERFPAELSPIRPTAVPDHPSFILEDRVRDELVARGLLEAQTPAFVGEAEGSVRLANPLSEPEPVVRRDLLPSLLRRVEHNFALGNRDVRLFEIATSFDRDPAGGAPVEQTRIAVALTGGRAPIHWSTGGGTTRRQASTAGGVDGTSSTEAASPVALDVWDLKGLAEDLALITHGPGARVEPLGSGEGEFVPGWTLAVVKDRRTVGRAGLVRAALLDTPAWAGDVWGLELTLPDPAPTREEPTLEPISRFPASERDLALTVPEPVLCSRVLEVIRARAGPLLEDVTLFDVYRSVAVGTGRRSLAFRLRFRSPKRTLRDKEIDRTLSAVTRALKEELGVEPRD